MRRCSDEIEQLRRSHAQLAKQVSAMTFELRNAKEVFNSERISIFNHFIAADNSAIYRTRLFSRLRAKNVLLATNAELGKCLPNLCASNSVVQNLLRSPPADCTLHDFQLFASRLLADATIRCRAYPSYYHIKFPISPPALSCKLCSTRTHICAKHWKLIAVQEKQRCTGKKRIGPVTLYLFKC